MKERTLPTQQRYTSGTFIVEDYGKGRLKREAGGGVKFESRKEECGRTRRKGTRGVDQNKNWTAAKVRLRIDIETTHW